MDKPRLFPWPCRDRFVRFGALGTFPGAPFYSLWNGIYNACPRSSPFREMQAAVEHRHGEERIPSYAMARYVATTPVFERLLRESRISCRPSDEPAWTYLLHAEGCRLPEAWRVRGISEKDLCMDAGAYLALLVLWTHYGGTTTLDQMFAQMVVDANEEACSAMVDQARQEQRAP